MNNTDLIWRNLSDFWGKIPEADKSVIEKLWEGWMQCVDAEYNQLYQIDFAKSLETCPVFNKYRWCLLDLSKKNLAKIKDYIASVKREGFVTQATKSVINDELKVANHVDHRHFYIRPLNFNKNIELPFNLEPALVEGFRLYNGPSLNGKELSFGPDYLINGNVIKLGTTVDNQTQVGFYVGINETNLEVGNDWKKHSEFTGTLKSTFILPTPYDPSIGIMVFVNGRFIHKNELTFDTANTVTINFPVTGTVDFLWYIKDASIKFNQFHIHNKQSFIFNPDAVSGTGTAGSISYITLSPPQSLDSTVKYSGPESQMRLFLRGNFYPEEFYTYNPATGIITFVTPISWISSEFVPIVVEFVDIQTEEFETSHIHVIRQYANVIVSTKSSTFDDGGRFDDGGNFDSSEDENQFDLEFEATDPYLLRIYFNGTYLYYQYDYIVQENNKTISFKFPIKNGNFRFEYERQAGRFSYGASDLDGLTAEQIRKINLLLFYNEDLELMGEFDVNSPEVDTKAIDAYKLASQDIYCVSIPQLQNRVDGADIIFKEKTLTSKGDYKIVNGGLQADKELPEFLWCPVVYFDESFLAKNFGVLVDYPKLESSEAYKQALKAIWSGLWNGPVIQNIQWIISMFLNVPYIPDNGKITSIVKSLVYTEILTESEKYYLDGSRTTKLKVGDQLFLGQGLENPSKYSDITSYSSIGEYGSTRLSIPNITVFAKSNDLISIANGSATGIYKIVRTEDDAIIINKPLSGSVGLIQDEEFDDTVTYDALSNSIGWPQFSPYIEIGTLIYFKDQYTTLKVIDKIQDRLVLDALPPVAIASGVKFIAYNANSFAIVESGVYPYVKRNATITSINRSYINRIYLNNGKFVDVPSEFDIDVVEGETVVQFQPVSNQVAVYDSTLRDQWLYERNSAFNNEVRSGGNDTIDRVLSSVCDLDGSWLTDTRTNFIGLVQIGDIVNISSGQNTNISYKVELVRNNQLKLAHEVSKDVGVYYSVDHVTKFIAPEDLPRQISTASPVEVELLDAITQSTVNIRLVSVIGLPKSGVLKATVGNNVEFIKYGYILENELRDCIRLFNEKSGNTSMALPAGFKLQLIFDFSEFVIREVFYAGIRAISEIADNKYITDNATTLFNLVKNNTTIIEMFAESGINQPDLNNISNFISKVLPSSSFWFIDINKLIPDIDERDPEEFAILSRVHFKHTKFTDTADYVKNLTPETSPLTLTTPLYTVVGDYVYIPSFVEKYAKIVEINGSILTLDRLLDSTNPALPVEIISMVNSGSCELSAINPVFTIDPGIQKGCTLTIIDGLNVGQYPIGNVIGNKIFIEGSFVESGNSIKYNFYVTSNEGTIL